MELMSLCVHLWFCMFWGGLERLCPIPMFLGLLSHWAAWVPTCLHSRNPYAIESCQLQSTTWNGECQGVCWTLAQGWLGVGWSLSPWNCGCTLSLLQNVWEKFFSPVHALALQLMYKPLVLPFSLCSILDHPPASPNSTTPSWCQPHPFSSPGFGGKAVNKHCSAQ